MMVRHAGAGDVIDEGLEILLAVLLVDADAAFHGHRHRNRRLHRRNAARDERRFRHQARPEAALLHPVRRTADIEVDLVIAVAGPDGRRLGELAGSDPPSCSATGCSCVENPSNCSRLPWITASAVTISVYSRAWRVISRWNTRQCRSVQSIMGATENLCR